jgi:predicted secreted Zn-dependent protease
MRSQLRSGRTALAALGMTAIACYANPTVDLGPMPAGVTAETQISYYDISAASLAEINQAIRASGPRSQGRSWGSVTTWHLSWQYRSERIGLECEAHRVQVRVRTSISFPRWNPTAQPDSAMLAFWHQYNAGLAEHERGHALLAVRSAGEIARALEGTLAPCPQLNARLNDTFSRMMVALNKQQAAYDVTTRHGATQIQQARQLQEP